MSPALSKAIFLMCILVSLTYSAYAQTDSWPQASKRLEHNAWYDNERDGILRSTIVFEETSKVVKLVLLHEVLNVQWQQFVDSTGHRPPLCVTDGENQFSYQLSHAWRGGAFPPGLGGNPVSCISVAEAILFCDWLSDKYQVNVALPTVREWESLAGDWKYPWGNEWRDQKCLAIGRDIVVGPDPVYGFTQDKTRSGIINLLGNLMEMTRPDGVSGGKPSTYTLVGSSYRCSPTVATLHRRTHAVISHAWVDTGFRYIVQLPADQYRILKAQRDKKAKRD